MFRIQDLSIRLAGNGEDEEDRLPPTDPDSVTCGQSAAPCSCGEHDTDTCAGGGEEEGDQEQEAQGLLREQLRRELGARP